jgi:hypothetical protein
LVISNVLVLKALTYCSGDNTVFCNSGFKFLALKKEQGTQTAHNRWCMVDIEKITQDARELAISKFVEKSTIPIIAYLDDSETGERIAGIQGTGTLFKFMEKYFIITAAHVLEQIDQRNEKNIGIPIDKNKPDLITLQNCMIYIPTEEEIREKCDFGIIGLTNEIGGNLEQNYHFLNEKNITFRIYDKMTIIITGYINKWAKFDKDKNILYTATPFKLMSRRKVPQNNYSEYDPRIHILAEYGETLFLGGDINKCISAEQELKGISGSSMWTIENDSSGIWSAEKCVKVIGIQIALMKEEYIKGTKWIYIAEAMKHIDISIHSLLTVCKGKSSK